MNYDFWDTFLEVDRKKHFRHLIPNCASNGLKYGLGYDYLASIN